MTFLNNLKISAKLLVAFGIVLSVLAINTVVTIIGVRYMEDEGMELSRDWLPSIQVLGKLNENMLQHRRFELGILLSVGTPNLGTFKSQMMQARQGIATARTEYETLISGAEERAAYTEFSKSMDNFIALSDKFVALIDADKPAEARATLAQESPPVFNAAMGHLRKCIDINAAGAEISRDNILLASKQTTIAVLGFAAAALILAVLAGLFLRSTIATPITAMTAAMGRLAGGDKATDIPARDRGDEMGAMAQAVQVFKDNMIRAEHLAAEQEADRAEQMRRARAVEELTDRFDTQVASVLSVVSGAATEMEATAQAMSSTAQQTNRQAMTVAAATEQATTSVQTVATAAEELAASIAEIGRQVEQSSTASRAASEEAKRTNVTVQELSQSSTRIGEVVGLINTIASQTNLLALNATIEAARAGDAGKGFAVVANEVKSLANQTAKATDEITSQISSVQSATLNAVRAIESIVGRITEIHQIAGAIAAAVEEQSAATAEIARNVQQAASGTQDVSSNIGGVSQAAAETGTAAEQVLAAARSLNRESVELKGIVDTFLTDVKSA